MSDSTKFKGPGTSRRENDDDHEAAASPVLDRKPRGLWQQLDGRASEPNANKPRGMWDWINARANGEHEASPEAIADRGVASPSAELPFRKEIQASFGSHDVSGIRAQIGGPAAKASQALGARAYATGDRVGFAEAPDLHTAAHEAAHVVQQRSGVALKGNIDQPGDEHEQHADAVADRVVRGESAAPLLDRVTGAGASSGQATGQVQRKPASSTTTGSAGPTSAPGTAEALLDAAPSETFKVKHDFHTSGPLSGSATLTVETGKSSLNADGGRLKAFKEAATLKLQGMAKKLEATILTGNLESLEVMDGVKISLDLSALKATTEDSSLELLAITLKLQGDISHWFGLAQVKVTIDGSVTYSLGDALAKELKAFVRADAEKRLLALEFEDVASEVEKHATAVRELETKIGTLETSGATRSEIAALEKELYQHKLQVSTGARQLERLGNDFEKAEGLAARTLAKIKGKPAKLIAGLMERQSMKLLGKTLSKLIPVLGVINAVASLRDAWKVIKAIRRGQFVIGDAPGGDGDEIGPPQEHAGKSTSSADGHGGESSTPDAHNIPISQAASGDQDRNSAKPALDKLSHPAHEIVDSLIAHGGPPLSASEITMIAMTIPPDLKPAEVAQVIAVLHAQGGHVTSGGQVIGAIGEAIRGVRGEPQTSAQGESVGDGPVTSPQQQTDPMDASDVITSAPESVIASWFELKSGEFVLSSAGRAWRAANVGKASVDKRILKDVQTGVAEMGDGEWNIELTFILEGGKTVKHGFFVSQPRTENGARAALKFESYLMLR